MFSHLNLISGFKVILEFFNLSLEKSNIEFYTSKHNNREIQKYYNKKNHS